MVLKRSNVSKISNSGIGSVDDSPMPPLFLQGGKKCKIWPLRPLFEREESEIQNKFVERLRRAISLTIGVFGAVRFMDPSMNDENYPWQNYPGKVGGENFSMVNNSASGCRIWRKFGTR